MTVRRRGRDDEAEGGVGRGARRGARTTAGVTPKELPGLRARGASLLLAVLATVGAIHGTAMLGVELQRVLHLRGEVARLERDIAVLQGEAADLRAVVAHADDELYREQLARRQGFVYPDEVRVMPLIPARATDPTAAN